MVRMSSVSAFPAGRWHLARPSARPRAGSGSRRPCYDTRVALTDYEKYIRTEELLGLQKTPEALTCHDELQFQIVHQAHELYMKLIEHELQFMCGLLETRELARAGTTLGRVARVQRVLLQSVDLLDTMAPTDYMTIRTGPGRGPAHGAPGARGVALVRR